MSGSESDRNLNLIGNMDLHLQDGGDGDVDEKASSSYRRYQQVFENDLIFNNIATYLTFSDLKNLSLVSTLALDKARSYKAFDEKCNLTLNKSSLAVISKSTHHWKSLRFEFCKDMDLTKSQVLKQIFVHIQNLHLTDKCGKIKAGSVQFKKQSKNCLIWLEAILLIPRDLKKLYVEPNQLVDGQDFILKNLPKVLDKAEDGLPRLRQLHFVKTKFGRVHVDSKTYNNIFGGFLKATSNLTCLEFVQFMKIVSPAVVDIPCDTEVAAMVQKNRESLNTFTLLDVLMWHPSWSTGELQQTICPSLVKLNVVVHPSDVTGLNTFLQNHLLLTSLQIQSIIPSFPLSTLASIPTIALTQLHLTVGKFEHDLPISPHEPILNWTFLAQMKCLEDFSMYEEYGYSNQNVAPVVSLLNNLPATMKKIYVQYPSTLANFHIDNEDIITAFSRFHELVELSFFDCGNMMDDEILQFVFQHFTKLRVLGFSEGSNVTEFGYTGIRSDGSCSGFSIQCLKGLRKLTIGDCAITNSNILLESIRFLELTHLDLHFQDVDENEDNLSPIITRQFALKIARQNPSLEYLFGIFEGGDQFAQATTAEIKRFSSRFKAIQNMWEDCFLNDFAGSGSSSESDTDSESEPYYEESDDESDGSSPRRANGHLGVPFMAHQLRAGLGFN